MVIIIFIIRSRSKTSLKCPICARAWNSLEEDNPSTSSSQTQSQSSSDSQEIRNGRGGRRRTRVIDDESDW